MKVVIMRGPPGSGKSTHVKQHFPGAVVCSADDYFMLDGQYVFDAKKLDEAHAACMKAFLIATDDMRKRQAELVVVDNVNMRACDLTPYAAVARARGYEVEIIRLNTDAHVAAMRNVHGVPRYAVMSMANNFEKCPPYLKEKVV